MTDPDPESNEQAFDLTIPVSSEEIAAEVGYGVLGRAMDIHENPDDDFEHVAIELRDLGQAILNEYTDTEQFEDVAVELGGGDDG